jgi:hypothetical protein
MTKDSSDKRRRAITNRSMNGKRPATNRSINSKIDSWRTAENMRTRRLLRRKQFMSVTQRNPFFFVLCG